MVRIGDSESTIIDDLVFKKTIILYLFKVAYLHKYKILSTREELEYLKLNEHYFSPNFKGYNYLIIFHQHNNIPYCVLIDRKNLSYHKDKIDYKKLSISIIKIVACPTIYQGTVMSCQLVKNNMIIKDCFQMMGKSCTQIDMIDKMNFIDDILSKKFMGNYCSNFSFKINKLYRYSDLNHVIKEIIPNCKYEIQGLIFIPVKSGTSIIFIDNKHIPSDNKIVITNNYDKKDLCPNESYNMIYNISNVLLSRKYSYEDIGEKKQFIVEKTNISDVYFLYESNNSYEKIGVAHIPNMKISKYCYENIKDRELCECIYYKNFNKWIPLKVMNL